MATPPRRKRASVTVLVIVGILSCFMAFASSASAYERFLPSGIDSVSPRKAAAQVLDYADLNDNYGATLARETRAFSYNRNDYVPRGYSKASADSSNSSLTGGGYVHRSSGGVGTKTLVLLNIRTGRKVSIMVRCANPRLGGKCHCKPVRIRRGKGIRIFKKFRRVVTKVCPSGQPVRVTVSGTVKGFVRGTVTARVLGDAKIFFHQRVELKIVAEVRVKCGKMPQKKPEEKKPEPPAVVVYTCPDGKVVNSPASCNVQQNNAELNCTLLGGTWINDVKSFCSITQVNGNCTNITIIYGDGNTVYRQEGNCNTIVNPPPSCEDCPPRRANRPPTIQIINPPRHVFINGRIQICAYISDPDGDPVTVRQPTAARGTVSTWYRPDTSNPTKYCVWYTAPGTGGHDVVTFIVTDGEFTTTASTDPFPNPTEVDDPFFASPRTEVEDPYLIAPRV